ncbi:translational machinery component, partial [Panus rudis PR-1116 ss-1]
PRYRLYVTATRNNTLITFTRPSGNPIATITGGTVGFKGAKKSSYEAGYACATKAFGLIKQVKEEENKMDLELFLSGFGQGRDAVYRALMSEEGSWVKDMIVRLTDKTPIKIGGTRSKK